MRNDSPSVVVSTYGRSPTTAGGGQRYAEAMTDAKRVIEEKELDLDADDRVWLREALDRYRELLAYLHEH